MTASKLKTVPAEDSHKSLETKARTLSPEDSTHLPELMEIEKKPRRPLTIHWGSFIVSLASLLLLIIWLAGPQTSVSPGWLWTDTGISIFFLIEFFTRSGFRWNPAGYMATHVFDFIAIVPALLLAYYGVEFQGIWVWIIVAARAVRAVDRLLGDGFFRRNALALVEGLEEEITDRVMLRIISRVQVDMDRSSFANLLADVLERNKGAVLEKIRSKHPQGGIIGGLAHVTKLDAALERGELIAFDTVTDIIKSPEIDHAVRDAVASIFVRVKAEIGVKTWRRHLGFKR